MIVAYIAVTIYDRKINSLEFVELTELIKVKSEELKKMLEKVVTLEKNYKDILKYYDDSLEEGDIGYYLSAEEILDLIIENGQK